MSKERNARRPAAVVGIGDLTATGSVKQCAAVKAFLKELGAKRIIYHRGTGKRDLKEMISAFPELEHEVFFMNENIQMNIGKYICKKVNIDNRPKRFILLLVIV